MLPRDSRKGYSLCEIVVTRTHIRNLFQHVHDSMIHFFNIALITKLR